MKLSDILKACHLPEPFHKLQADNVKRAEDMESELEMMRQVQASNEANFMELRQMVDRARSDAIETVRKNCREEVMEWMGACAKADKRVEQLTAENTRLHLQLEELRK